MMGKESGEDVSGDEGQWSHGLPGAMGPLGGSGKLASGSIEGASLEGGRQWEVWC